MVPHSRELVKSFLALDNLNVVWYNEGMRTALHILTHPDHPQFTTVTMSILSGIVLGGWLWALAVTA